MRLKELLMLFTMVGNLVIEIGTDSFDGKLYQNAKRYENFKVKNIEVDANGNVVVKSLKSKGVYCPLFCWR